MTWTSIKIAAVSRTWIFFDQRSLKTTGKNHRVEYESRLKHESLRGDYFVRSFSRRRSRMRYRYMYVEVSFIHLLTAYKFSSANST